VNGYNLLLALVGSLETKSTTSLGCRNLKHTRCGFTNASVTAVDASASATSNTAAAFALHRKRIRRPWDLRTSLIDADAVPCRDKNEDFDPSKSRQMVIFRAPSRHTYGFISDSNNYDLPIVEFRSLLKSVVPWDIQDIRFIPVTDHSLQPSQSGEGGQTTILQKPKSKKQSKKKKSAKDGHHVQLLYWIECSNGLSSDDISKAASHAILTHATFSIQESVSFTDEDWNDALLHCSNTDSRILFPFSAIVEQMEVIDMDNPNMSRDSRSQLIRTVSRLMEMNKYIPKESPNDMQPILIHQCITPPQQESNLNGQKCMHHLYFGHRTSISPAGTKGAPSQTLRRTHRGLLKQYALKNRVIANGSNEGISNERSNTSTAMEPEIGFLMANLAMAGYPSGCRVLDPCCGSGSLLLYAAALGAKELVGVDSDPLVWKNIECEFHRHQYAIDGRTSLVLPEFLHGDVLNPLASEVLCQSNSVEAIVCDPPYNIGAPVLVDGKDARPRNHHFDLDNNPEQLEGKLNNGVKSRPVSPDLVPHILEIARKVLVNGGRVVFLLPVRKEELSLPVEEVLLAKGCKNWELYEKDAKEGESGLFLLKHSTRLQYFSPTFSRWLVCMEQRTNCS